MALRIKKETQLILCDYLKCLSKLEGQSEILRQKICQKQSFSPYEMFKRIDRFDHGKIDVSDILEFITEYDLILSDEDLILFIKCNSINGDIILNYTDFLSIILPRDDQQLRSWVAQKQPQRMDIGKKLDIDTEQAMSKLINEETSNLTNLERLKYQLELQSDGQAAELFVSIDTLNNLHVTPKDLDRFFRRNGLLIQGDELQRIFQRIDPNNTGFITEQNLSRVLHYNLKPIASTHQIQTRLPQATKNTTISFQPTQKQIQPLKQINYDTHQSQTNSPTMKQGQSSRRMSNFNSKSQNMQSQRTNDLQYKDHPKQKQKNHNHQELQFLKFLIDLLHLEHELEQLKCDMSKQDDFTIMDAFHFIDLKGNGSINQIELRQFCNDYLRFDPSPVELKLFVQRHDKEGNLYIRLKQLQSLRFSDFNNFFQPIDKKFRCPRQAINQGLSYSFENMFSVQTQTILKEIFKVSFQNEQKIQIMKKSMAHENLDRLYNYIDKQNKGFINLEDLTTFFSIYNIKFNELNIRIIIKWFSGKNFIPKSEFFKSITDEFT